MFPKIRPSMVKLTKYLSKTRPWVPVLFIYPGPWTADVHHPRLNSCVMSVVTTALAACPVKNRSLPRAMIRWQMDIQKEYGWRGQTRSCPRMSRMGKRQRRVYSCDPCDPCDPWALRSCPAGQASSPAGCRTVPDPKAPRPAPRAPLLSPYIALNRPIEIMNAAPSGKIGRLSHMALREEATSALTPTLSPRRGGIVRSLTNRLRSQWPYGSRFMGRGN